MAKFDVVKNGYDKRQVDNYIDEIVQKDNTQTKKILALEEELAGYKSQDKQIKERGENISIALTAAVEKAKQIEKSSQNVYKLKIQQINLLYSKWEKLLNSLIERYPGISDVENVKQMLDEFKNSLKTTLKDDFKISSLTSPVKTDNDTIRLLLSKLGGKKEESVVFERKQLSKDMLQGQTELSRIEEKAPLIRPIYDNKIHDGENYENLADKFLTESSNENNAYANIITSKVKAIPEVNETGFDLKEAINPKDDLEDIMKAFDFYDNDDDK